MENHDNHGHDNGHDDAHTEGNRQAYPKGWYLSLVGLVAVALLFTFLGTFIFSHSGTERWGQTEQCENDKCCGEEGCKDDKDKCEDKKGEATESSETKTVVLTDSTKATDVKVDTAAKPAEHK